MVRQKTGSIFARLLSHPLYYAWAAAALLAVAQWGMALPLFSSHSSTQIASSPASDQPANQLSEADIALYQAAYDAQDRQDYKSTDAIIAQLANRRLVGHLLAERYLSAGYKATPLELNRWLARYDDHPEAAQIVRLATRHGVHTQVATEAPLKGDGYAEHLGRSTMPDSWYHGLALWRERQYGEALAEFKTVAANESLSDWERSAGYYWAYRAASRLGNDDTAAENLGAAANYSTTFYGLIARGEEASLSTIEARAPKVSQQLRDNPATIRAQLLTQLGRTDDAERELRYLYSSLDAKDRPGLVTIAYELRLSNLQVRLANIPQLTPEERRFASYPTPDFVVGAQKDVDPALMLAIARNESSFRDEATSSSGAVGLMQMLPSTAHAVERRVGRHALELASLDESAVGSIIERLNDPATSVRYSAQYVKILKHEPGVGANLVRVIAAYNAGPGSVASWEGASQQMNRDPLLYIESIPYAETRNYVIQVMAQYWVYQLMQHQQPQGLRQIGHGQWPVLG